MRSSDSEVIASSMTHPAEFAAIFDRHVDPVRHFVAARLGARRTDDVVSEVFRIAFEQRDRFDLAAPLALPWLYGIAGNLVRHEHRDHARWLAALERVDGRRDVGGGDPLLDAAARLDAGNDRALLVGALLTLGADERDMLLLIAWEELTPTEAAAVLGIPAATARTRLHRARLHVRAHLARQGHTREATTDVH